MASDDGHDGLGELSSEVEDATMEISLQDIYSIKEEDKRQGLDSGSSADDSHDEFTTVERPAVSIEAPPPLEDTPTPPPSQTAPPEPPSRFEPPGGEPTTQLAFDASDFTGQGLDEELLEEDTNPSMVTPPEVLEGFDDFEGMGDEPTDPTFDRPLAELEDRDELLSVDSNAYDELDPPGPSTSVPDPNEELLARASWHDPAFEEEEEAPDPEDATGHFEIPAALLSQLHEPEPSEEEDDDELGHEDATGHFEIPAALLSQLRERDEATSPPEPEAREPLPELSDPHISVMEIEAIAEVDAQGRLVLPEQIVRVGPLRPGMRVHLKIQILK